MAPALALALLLCSPVKFSRALVFISVLWVGCAPPAKSRESFRLSTTGYTSPEGDQYLPNGDTRVRQALKQAEDPATPAPVKAAAKQLRERLREFEISRFEKGNEKPVRFGDERAVLKFMFLDHPTVVFQTKLNGTKPKWRVDAEADGFKLAGEVNDVQDPKRGEITLGDFTLTEKSSGGSARVLYWAYKAKLKVRPDRMRKVVQGSTIEKIQNDLQDHTFGWVNNWSVVKGVSFFLTDVVKQSGRSDELPPVIFAVKGLSRITNGQSQPVEKVAGAASRIEMVGNSDESAARMFQVTVQDEKSQRTDEFMLDVELDQEKPPQLVEAAETPDLAESAAPAPSPSPAPTPAPGPTYKPQVLPPGRSFLRATSQGRRTAKMISDFNKSRNVKGVKEFMRIYGEGKRHPELQAFYKYAYPFIRLFEKIGQAFDVSPAYAYITAAESQYFTGGKYEIQPNWEGSAALGPFQFMPGTATGLGMLVEERRYFVPSACGAAKYISQLVDDFDDSDSTLSILGFGQGTGGAAAAIYCAYDKSVKDVEACNKRINATKARYTPTEYQRYFRLVKNYNYNYADMVDRGAVREDMRDDVNKKLAIYFISNDYAKYKFNISGSSELPRNGTVTPRSIHDPLCRKAVEGLNL